MRRYIALLRGINISGRNKISMPVLRVGFEELGFGAVKTYLNSGNVIFSSDESGKNALADRIGAMIKSKFGLEIPIFVIAQAELEDILRNAPKWWGNENAEIYDNLIFVLPPATSVELLSQAGAPKEGFEKVLEYNGAVFWSFRRKDYQKTNWWSKTACVSISGKLTIRTANTVRKIVGM